ncbi:alpha/beta hydrolase [Paeniglutamicibacter gangotriensis]|uniref:Tripeptidyl aminopeptidase n=2 Tax=Bacillati TaxID=1783272 RepID=M7MXE1_9MICC|nr:alpha/beta hydrolase [Paeniglutamicibacter gangotriensis]EMQ99726.1 Tripeptidyl aminopeptidase precursor [Paeniglutamicibacter gangotriensis Lz1y]
MAHKRLGRALGMATAVGLLAGTAFISPANAAPPLTKEITILSAPAVQTAKKSTHNTTSKAERKRVDGFKTPTPKWFNCSPLAPGAQCATVKLPLDYDNPRGAKTEVAMLRIKAKNQKKRIGTLFVNPGGPGGSGIQIAAAAPDFLSPKVLDRFDVVGVDPRGTNFSDNVRCWKNLGVQGTALDGMNVPYPDTAKETRAFVKSSKAFGKACSTTGKPLSASMSTAEVARDMDVLRRMVGDKQLTYLGFSYGSYLGTVYANMFPDRVRAVALDGVLDPVAWAGTSSTTGTPQTQRIKSGEGAEKAIRGILSRCKKAGKDYCQLAGQGDPEKLYRTIMAELKRSPLVFSDPDYPEYDYALTAAAQTASLLSYMYDPQGSTMVDGDLTFVLQMLQDRAAQKGTTFPKAATKTKAPSKAKMTVARKALAKSMRAVEAEEKAAAKETSRKAAATGFAFPYDNSPEAFQSVLCTDSRNPAKADNWSRYAATASISAPGFGQLWTWASAPCASTTWKAKDEDSYKGPFTRQTKNPMLVVGNYWDPATNYSGAQKVATLMPNSRLLSSNSWGHTAYGTSKCVTDAMDRYLLTKQVPAVGKLCAGDVQPFTEKLDDFGDQRRKSSPDRQLPPVVPPLPGALPRT